MPVMDGYTATREIRKYERENDLRPTVIIALTAHAQKADEQKSIDAGCNSHLTKPIKKKILIDTIAKHVTKEEKVMNMKDKNTKEDFLISKSDQDEKSVVTVDSSFKDVIPLFLDDIRNDIKTMKESLNKGDYKTILSIGHNIKGAGGGYGFNYISDIRKNIEEASEDKNPEKIQKWLIKLSEYLETLHVVYNDKT